LRYHGHKPFKGIKDFSHLSIFGLRKDFAFPLPMEVVPCSFCFAFLAAVNKNRYLRTWLYTFLVGGGETTVDETG
jgi:hypothetical protein